MTNRFIMGMRMRNIRNHTNKIDGHSLTVQRQLLLRLIRGADGHIDAKELYRRASSMDKSISLATVYRNLHFFKELGLVDERRLGQVCCYYEVRQLGEHQHLVCKGCRAIIEFESPLIRRLVDEVQREHGFNVTKAELYLEGYCQECKQETKGGSCPTGNQTNPK